MSIRVLTFAACLGAATMALAQQGWTPPPAAPPDGGGPESAVPEAAPDDPAEDGLDLIERGMRDLFGRLLNDAAPHLDRMGRDMSDVMALLGPALNDLAVLVDDIGNYQAPERLENGDIIIRRKAGAPPVPPVGEGLRRLPDAGGEDAPGAGPVDPYAPQIEL